MENALKHPVLAQPRADDPARQKHHGLKRFIDIVASLLAIVLFSPLFLMIVLLVRLTEKGPAFYSHRRVGRHGREFGCLKFRTMAVNGDAILASHLLADPAACEEWTATRKLQNDPRVTPTGRVLRRLSLDELPQLLNVLAGHMSIVGPRPVVRAELQHYGADVDCYLSARPGLTGLWQISGRNDVSYAARVAFDRHYAANWSVGTDIVIILRTIPAVCLAKGSY